jgi:hypothetical protein
MYGPWQLYTIPKIQLDHHIQIQRYGWGYMVCFQLVSLRPYLRCLFLYSDLYMYIYVDFMRMYIDMNIFICTYLNVHICMHIFVYIYYCIYMHLEYIYICTYVYIHIHTDGRRVFGMISLSKAITSKGNSNISIRLIDDYDGNHDDDDDDDGDDDDNDDDDYSDDDDSYDDNDGYHDDDDGDDNDDDDVYLTFFTTCGLKNLSHRIHVTHIDSSLNRND